MPLDVGKLKNLQVLSLFTVNEGSEAANIQQLGELNLHGELSIIELQNIVNPFDALAANMKNKVHLEELTLSWNAKSNNSEKDREVLEKLQPSKHLKELWIFDYGGTRFPHWFGDNSLSNMVFLKLSNCENCVVLPSLGVLQSLKELWITRLSGIVMIGSEFYGNGSSSSSDLISFASLQTLQFQDMEGWDEWDCKFATGAFPCLKELCIRNCPNLKGNLPEQLPSLTTLKIFDCKQLAGSVSLAPSIQKLYLCDCEKLQVNYQTSTLRILSIGRCCMEGSLLEWVGQTLSNTSLESLEIQDCPTMKIPIDCCYNFLLSLDITSSCDSLRIFPLDFFPKLQSLHLRKCSNLEIISQEHERDLSLTCLTISQCPKFVSFPKAGFSAPSLESLYICNLENLKSLPESMHTLFPSLTYLDIYDCPQLESFGDEGLPSSLKYMDLRNCSKLFIASLKCA